MRIVAVVLAAGEGRRMGGPKALLRLEDGTSFLARACANLSRPTVARVIVVLGAQASRVRAEAGLPAGVGVVLNERWEEGMLSSVLRGLDAAEADAAAAVLLHPVDTPFVAPATVDAVADALAAGAKVAVPSWEGRRGHPAGFARSVFAELRAADASRGARAVLAARPDRVVHVSGDPGCVRGVNTPADLPAGEPGYDGGSSTPGSA